MLRGARAGAPAIRSTLRQYASDSEPMPLRQAPARTVAIKHRKAEYQESEQGRPSQIADKRPIDHRLGKAPHDERKNHHRRGGKQRDRNGPELRRGRARKHAGGLRAPPLQTLERNPVALRYAFTHRLCAEVLKGRSLRAKLKRPAGSVVPATFPTQAAPAVLIAWLIF